MDKWLTGLVPTAALGRWAGPLRRLSLPSSIPWQRVVNAQGRISMSLSREGSDWMQRDLLLAEGIPVDEDGRLPLKHVCGSRSRADRRGARSGGCAVSDA